MINLKDLKSKDFWIGFRKGFIQTHIAIALIAVGYLLAYLIYNL